MDIMTSQYGLRWEDTLMGQKPRWAAEPSAEQIERISRVVLHLDKDAPCVVKEYAQGAFNKLFTVDTATAKHLMRVALPVDPSRKTASEVATMSFVRKNTSTPLPAILGYDASNGNALRFEWILMEHMPGDVLGRAWRSLSMVQKESLVRQLAQFHSELFCESRRYRMSGNLFESNSESYTIGSIVSMSFFWGNRGVSDIDRGPFKNSHAWLSARLSLVIQDQDNILSRTDDEDEISDAQTAKTQAQRLIALLPTIFPPEEVESTMLFHDDLHAGNILVDQQGSITAVLDWECVSVLPLWMACQPPALLSGLTRLTEPHRETYAPYDPENDEETAEYNQGLADIYWDHLMEYERGQSSHVYLSEMARLAPDWLVQHQAGELKRDFELAILHCSAAMTVKQVERWLDSYQNGENRSLRESLNA